MKSTNTEEEYWMKDTEIEPKDTEIGPMSISTKKNTEWVEYWMKDTALEPAPHTMCYRYLLSLPHTHTHTFTTKWRLLSRIATWRGASTYIYIYNLHIYI